MKTKITRFAVIAFLTLISYSTQSQTITFNLLHAPCNNDGVLVVETTGIPTPYNLSAHGTFNFSYSHTSNFANDTIYNYNGESIYVNISNMWGNIVSNIYPGHPPFTDSIFSTIANCTNGTATVSLISGGQSPYTYLWSNGATSSSITGLMAGNYNVTVTDANGCYYGNGTNINQSIIISDSSVGTSATCLNNDGGIITFGYGGVSPYSYLWINGQTSQSVSGLATGVYYVIVTDANGCVGNGYGQVNSTTPITVTDSSSFSLCTSPTGTATILIAGGTPPYSIVWSTYPIQTTATATNLSPGLYPFTVTDAVGCIQTGSVYVPPIGYSSTYASISSTNAMCLSNNGTANIVINTLFPPCTYHWNTGSTTPTISNLPPGAYSCTATDSMGCSVTKQTYVYRGSPLQLNFSSTSASCIFNSDGTATVNVVGGTPPYTYSWSNGSATNTASGLATGWYWLTVNDAAGCQSSQNCFVNYDATNNSCYCTVSGTVYNDANNNCTLDAGEQGIQNIMVHLSGIGYVYTDAQGNYSFIAPSGNYTLSENVGAYYPLSSCQNNNIAINTIAATGCIITQNIANVINPLHDVGIYTTYFQTPPIPGNPYQQLVVVNNQGTVTESTIETGYKHDGQLDYTSTSPGLFTQQSSALAPDWYSVVSGSFPTLAPHTNQLFDVQYNVPTNIPLGTSLTFNDSAVYSAPMSTWVNDYTPWNNVNAYSTNVVGSWDPNEKEVSPKGAGRFGIIDRTDSVLTYTIHFQNTGTYFAQNIVVIDTLSSNLNIATLEPIYSNHHFTTTVSETGIVKFTFENIYLPYYIPSSTGVIIYTIHLKPNLPDYSTIKNTANIYFDYNAGIRTNTTLNTIGQATGITSFVNKDSDILIYPNPTTGIIQISCLRFKVQSIKVINVIGECLLNQQLTTNSQQLTIDMSGYAKGIYFIQLTDENKNIVNKKIVVQ